MAYGIGSTLGVSFIPSSLPDQAYDPVFDTEMDPAFLWQVLPSFYRTLMDDQDIHDSVRSGVMQVIAADLLRLWEIDYSKSLRDIPVRSQRKWVSYEFVRSFDFLTDPALSVTGLSDRYVYDASTDQLDVTWLNRGGVDRGFLELNAPVTDDASLSWSFDINISAAQINAVGLVGYHSSRFPRDMTQMLAVGVANDPSAADSPQPIIVHVSVAGDLTFIRSVTLDTDVDYRFDATYTASSGIATLSVVELEATKISSTSGATGEDDSTFTGEFTDDAFDFDASGIVEGDLLVLDGVEYEIVDVSGATLVVEPGSLPAGASNLTYEIKGESEITSLILDLPSDAGDPTFTVDQFGLTNLDIRSGLSLVSGDYKRKKMTGAIKRMAFLDPTVAQDLLEVPRLQDSITDPQEFLFSGTDYQIDGSTFIFQEPPSSTLWAEYAAYDEGFIQDNFGDNVNLQGVSSRLYRSQVRGIYYAFYQGPTPTAIRIGVQILLGLPIAEEAGEVESINPSFSGDFGEIVVAGRSYLYPLAVGTSLSVGDDVPIYAPLSNGVEIQDYINSPEWFDNSSAVDELQKYHTFRVSLNVDAFDVTDIAFAAAFVDEIKPTWKDKVFLVFKELEDEVDLDDDLSFKAVFTLADVPCDAVLPRYGSNDFEGEEADWRFDQGNTDWDVTSAAMRQTATPMSGTALFINTSTAVGGTGTVFLTDIGGPGAVVGKYLAIGRFSSGTDMVTVSGSNVVTDTVTGFADVVQGDIIDIPSEGGTPFEVQSVDSPTQLTLDSPMTADATGVVWSNDGALLIWGQVASVATDGALTLSTPFTGTTGTYVMALLDNDYRQVYYDQFLEGCPDELLTFTSILSTGYREILLVANSPARMNWTQFSIGVNATDARFVVQLGDQSDMGINGTTDASNPINFTGEGTETFLTTIPNSGAGTPPSQVTWIHLTGPDLVARVTQVVSDTELKLVHDVPLENLSAEPYEIYLATTVATKYITTPDGGWYEVTSIVDHENLQVQAGAHATFTDVLSYTSDILGSGGGTATFNNGSKDVGGTGTAFLSQVSAGDWIQIVPTQDYSDPTGSTPVVEVDTVNSDFGPTAITLVEDYGGLAAAGVKIIKRGDSSVLPIVVNLPNGPQNITDWFGTLGGSVTDDVVEPTP